MKGHPYSHCPSLPSRPRSRSSPPSPLGCSLFVVLFFFVPFLPAAAPRSSFTCKIRLNFPPLRKEGRKGGRTKPSREAKEQRKESISLAVLQTLLHLLRRRRRRRRHFYLNCHAILSSLACDCGNLLRLAQEQLSTRVSQ